MLNTDTLVRLNALADGALTGDPAAVLADEDALAQLSESEFNAYLIARYGIEG